MLARNVHGLTGVFRIDARSALESVLDVADHTLDCAFGLLLHALGLLIAVFEYLTGLFLQLQI